MKTSKNSAKLKTKTKYHRGKKYLSIDTDNTQAMSKTKEDVLIEVHNKLAPFGYEWLEHERTVITTAMQVYSDQQLELFKEKLTKEIEKQFRGTVDIYFIEDINRIIKSTK